MNEQAELLELTITWDELVRDYNAISSVNGITREIIFPKNCIRCRSESIGKFESQRIPIYTVNSKTFVMIEIKCDKCHELWYDVYQVIRKEVSPMIV